jgi:hypothetical protein
MIASPRQATLPRHWEQGYRLTVDADDWAHIRFYDEHLAALPMSAAVRLFGPAVRSHDTLKDFIDPSIS